MKYIEILKNELLNKGYEMTSADVADFKKQLKRKPIQLYIMAIKHLEKTFVDISYMNIVNLIKSDIKIRNEIINFITALEQNRRTIYIKTKIKHDDIEGYKKTFKMTFSKIIKSIEHDSDADIDCVRVVRNKVNHLVYPVIHEEFDFLVDQLKKIRLLSFVDISVLDKLIVKIVKIKN